MSKEKQIEEMAKVIDEFTEPLSARDIHKVEFSEQFAEALFNAGYRKQSEVAREIFEEIERVIGEKYDYYVFDNRDIEGVEQDAIIAFADTMQKHFADLKKKYTEGGAES